MCKIIILKNNQSNLVVGITFCRDTSSRGVVLEFAEESYQQWYAEIDDESVEDGNNNKVFAARTCEYGQCGVHGCGTSHRDGSQWPEPSHHERRAKQSYYLAHYVCQ